MNSTNIGFLNDEGPSLPVFLEPDFELTNNLFTLSPADDTASKDHTTEDASLILPTSSSIPISCQFSDELPVWDNIDSFSTCTAPTTCFTPESTAEASKQTLKRHWQMQSSPPYPHSGISEFSSTQNMIARTNNGLMTDNLMKLYHDVLEGALSCWLTEQNCPYIKPPCPWNYAEPKRFPGFEASQSLSNIPNRVYQRVFKLDKALMPLGIKPLSAVDDGRATKALHLAIMAFTTQWGQGSRMSQARYGQSSAFNGNTPTYGAVEEFDRTVQISFWNQARRCLDDSADIDSFKVAMAELLFGLTQKPNDEFAEKTDGMDQFKHRSTTEEEYKENKTAGRIQMALDGDGNFLYIERGARRLHVLKRQSERVERSYKSTRDSEKVGHGSCNIIPWSEEKKTMRLVFWLAIMFDTLSAAITQRPLTVSDEESKENRNMEDAEKFQNSNSSRSEDRWNDRYIIKQNQRLAPLRWPCPVEDISRELRDAAPVKVLLFRKITRIQSLSSYRASQRTIEDAIQDGLSVYRHWNMTYGPLFQDCIQYHDSLPPKVQSWYVCLLGHWLLAVMILADCISLMDKEDFSMPLQAKERADTDLVNHLRKTSIQTVSDLARVSTPRDDGIGRLLDFHPAVNEGALLTEPWTIVLIRSFAMAGTSLLKEAMRFSNQRLEASGRRSDVFSRCEDCVKALWYLGRKSNLSRQIAGILENDLRVKRLETFGMESSFAAYGS